jgi:protein TonB
VLDTRDRMGRAVTAARTPLELHSKQGSDETSQPSAPSPDQQLSPKPEDVVEAPPPTATVVARPDPDERPNEQELVLPVAPEVGPQTPETTEQPVPLTVAAERTEAREQSVPSVAAEAAEAGGATAQGLAPTAAMEPAAAQGGETTLQLSEYARSVVETLSRRKPRISGGQRGTVRIEFAIGLNGEVVSARILTSSGYASLDQAALAAVRGTQFAKPPPGSGAGDVRYAIPFYFR